MSSCRQKLVSLILSQAVRVNGELIDTAEPVFDILGSRLGEAGVQACDVVVLSGLQGRDLVIATMAVWRLDAVPMPSSESSTVHIVRDACRITKDLTVIPGSPSCRTDGLETTAVLHTSSGTTDQPKLAKRSVQSVLLEAEGYRAGLSLVPDDCVAVPIPLVHSLGWGVATSALISGCSIDVAPFVRVNTLARKVDSGAVSVLALTAPLARLLVATQPRGGTKLRAALVGAGPVTDELNDAFRARFGQPLLRGYGSSETGGTLFGTSGIGRPIPGVEIVQPSPGECGELILRLAAPVEGYLDGNKGPSRQWSTGDVVQHGLDGVVYFVERTRGPLRLNGRFIGADVVEKALRSVPGVEDVFFFVLPRLETPEIEDFYAVVEGDVSEEVVVKGLTGCVSELPVPRVFRCRRMPRNMIGKPDRDAMIDMVRRGNGCA
jgi:acyl-CoA synthetase (AMP-forming)/AMP-acid ligase II